MQGWLTGHGLQEDVRGIFCEKGQTSHDIKSLAPASTVLGALLFPFLPCKPSDGLEDTDALGVYQV